MKHVTRWALVSFLIFITVLMAHEGTVLWSQGTNVDGHGIGVFFLGLEINDRVPETQIPSYAICFFIASAITFLITVVLAGISSFKSKSNSNAT